MGLKEDRRSGYLGPADDEAEPTPHSTSRLTVAVCHHCEGTIAKNKFGEWEHIAFTGLVCD